MRLGLSAGARLTHLCLGALGRARNARFSSSIKATSTGGHFNPAALRFLADPQSKAPLRYDAAAAELVCDETGMAYPIVNGIPCLLPSAGRLLPSPEAQAVVGGPQVSPQAIAPWSE